MERGCTGETERLLCHLCVQEGSYGCWRPLEGTNPYLGSVGEISSEPELKVEVTCRRARVDETVEAVKCVHPYEEPVINVIPLYRTSF